MSYGIRLTSEAEKDLASMPQPVRRETIKQLRVLGEHATALSERSRFPYIEKCQLFRFDFDDKLQRWLVCVMFQYDADEQNLHVLLIGRSVMDLGDGVDVGE